MSGSPAMEKLGKKSIQCAFVELQGRVVEAQRQAQHAEGRMEALSRTAMGCELTLQQISALPSKTRLFQGVGRMFVPILSFNCEEKTLSCRFGRSSGSKKAIAKMANYEKKGLPWP
uniref:Uncharacterized protein n=1 Tax=Eptatretus burgeri TaxID=7764 RepID=A0A8C4QWR7_EPTBU